MAAGRNGRAKTGRSETGPGQSRPPGQSHGKPPRNLMVGKGRGESCNRRWCDLHAERTGAGATQRRRRQRYGRPGRIAGSANVPPAQLLDPATNTFLPADDIRQKFASVGALDREVIVYCGGGIAASADAFALPCWVIRK